MSIKIKVSYQDEQEARLIMGLLKPIIPLFKVKKSEGKPPYKHLAVVNKNWTRTQRKSK